MLIAFSTYLAILIFGKIQMLFSISITNVGPFNMGTDTDSNQEQWNCSNGARDDAKNDDDLTVIEPNNHNIR